MARGDVFYVDLPAQPGAGGHEQTGLRPAIAVQTDQASPTLPTIMVVPFTGQLSASRFPFTVLVDPSNENGLAQPSVLLVFQLRAIDRKRMRSRIGHLEQGYLEQLETEIKRLLDLQ